MGTLGFEMAGGVVLVAAGMAIGWLAARRHNRDARAPAVAPRETLRVTRLDAHLSSASGPAPPPGASASLRRDVREAFDSTEAQRDLDVLDLLLRDIRDLSQADETILWRWIEARGTLVPSAWSTEDATRPAWFNVERWAPLVRESAETRMPLTGADDDARTVFAAAPITVDRAVCGVLTVSATGGLPLEPDDLREWLDRFAARIGSLVRLFDMRRDYGRQMRQNGALLDAVTRLQGHSSPAKLGDALCDVAREVTSATSTGLVRWNAAEHFGVVQAASSRLDLEPGFHVSADSIVGRACIAGVPLIVEDARVETSEQCPFGGMVRRVGSVAVVPVLSEDRVIGALIAESDEVAVVGQDDARNLGLLAAVARSPLEVAWEIEEVTRRARTDALTGLANRRHFDEQLRRVILETDRFGGSCSLVLIDLDHFKIVNDTHGHDAGDAVLRSVAQQLVDAVRTVDLCARYGGEEIALLLPQTSEVGASELAERLRIGLSERRVAFGEHGLAISASFGVATYPVPVPYGDWLVAAADKALYEAKANGRNCVKVIRPSDVTPALYKVVR